MSRVSFAGLIAQQPIDLDRIRAMVLKSPRRYRLATEWTHPLKPPQAEGSDPFLLLPFCETYRNAFLYMCGASSIGLRENDNGRCWTFVKEPPESAGIRSVEAWLAKVGRFVALRDCLALSFALDYDRENGDPAQSQTEIGALRSRAKPYDRAPTSDTLAAAEELAARCTSFVREMTCYQTADAIIAMPPSTPNKKFDLPNYLAREIAEAVGMEDLSRTVVTRESRSPLKDARVADKLDILIGTIQVDAELTGRRVILLDDLYQSGTSMNYTAMELLAAGADAVYGLACEKTCRNDDNTSRSI